MPLPSRPRWPQRVLLSAALLLPVAVAPVAAPAASQAAASGAVDAREAAVLTRINAIRADRGLAALQLGSRLSRAADRHSQRMASARMLAHQVPGEGSLSGRLRWATGRALVGETVFWVSGSARSATIVRAWMRSPGHRELLLSPKFRMAGVGIRPGSGGHYATVDLSSR